MNKTIASTSSTLSTIIAVTLTILGIVVFIVIPIGRYYARRPTRRDGALCRRLRRLGRSIDPPADERTLQAIADVRAGLIKKLTGGSIR